MPITKEIQLFTFDELDDDAKEVARDWWRSCRDSSDFDFVVEDFERLADMLGVTLKSYPVRLMGGGERYQPDVAYSIGYCQSDYAAFAGRYTFQKGATAAVKAYAPKDKELHRIASELSKAQALHGFKLSAEISYSSYYGMQTEVMHDSDIEVSDAADSILSEAFKDLARWLYETLRKEDEWQTADEQVDESIEANEYTFRLDGKRED